jgi:hypothetical protein
MSIPFNPAHIKMTVTDMHKSIFKWETTDSNPESERTGHVYCFNTQDSTIKVSSNITIDNQEMTASILQIYEVWLLCNEQYTDATMYLKGIRGMNIPFSKSIPFSLTNVQRRMKNNNDVILNTSDSTLKNANDECSFAMFGKRVMRSWTNYIKVITLHENNCEILIQTPEVLTEYVGGRPEIRYKEYVLSFQLQPRPP